MPENNPAVSVALNKLKYNIVSNYVEKNLEPEEIVKELKKIKLYTKAASKNTLEKYIQNNMFLVWDTEKKKWQKDKQISFFDKIPDIEDQKSWEDIVNNLTASQQLDLLKNMKEILMNMKEISKEVTSSTKEIVTITKK